MPTVTYSPPKASESEDSESQPWPDSISIGEVVLAAGKSAEISDKELEALMASNFAHTIKASGGKAKNADE